MQTRQIRSNPSSPPAVISNCHINASTLGQLGRERSCVGVAIDARGHGQQTAREFGGCGALAFVSIEVQITRGCGAGHVGCLPALHTPGNNHLWLADQNVGSAHVTNARNQCSQAIALHSDFDRKAVIRQRADGGQRMQGTTSRTSARLLADTLISSTTRCPRRSPPSTTGRGCRCVVVFGGRHRLVAKRTGVWRNTSTCR